MEEKIRDTKMKKPIQNYTANHPQIITTTTIILQTIPMNPSALPAFLKYIPNDLPPIYPPLPVSSSNWSNSIAQKILDWN